MLITIFSSSEAIRKHKLSKKVIFLKKYKLMNQLIIIYLFLILPKIPKVKKLAD